MGTPGIVRIGLASVSHVPSVEERLATLENVLDEARGGAASIVCFPETYIPGLRGHWSGSALPRAGIAWPLWSAWSGNRTWGSTTSPS